MIKNKTPVHNRAGVFNFREFTKYSVTENYKIARPRVKVNKLSFRYADPSETVFYRSANYSALLPAILCADINSLAEQVPATISAAYLVVVVLAPRATADFQGFS